MTTSCRLQPTAGPVATGHRPLPGHRERAPSAPSTASPGCVCRVARTQIPACCANAETSQCGAATGEGEPLSIAELVAQLSTNAGCVGLNEPGDLTPGEDGIPGNEDHDCPSLEAVIGSQLMVPMQDPVDLPGCCQPSGTCGFFADFSMAIEGGPNFGCADYTTFEDSEGNQPTPGTCTPPE